MKCLYGQLKVTFNYTCTHVTVTADKSCMPLDYMLESAHGQFCKPSKINITCDMVLPLLLGCLNKGVNNLKQLVRLSSNIIFMILKEE